MNSLQQKAKIKSCFNRAAYTYDKYCYLQTLMGKELIKSIQTYTLDHFQIIDLGCGTGNTTKKLAETLTYQKLLALDNAELLLQMAAKRLLPLGVQILPADFDNIPLADGAIDVAFSNMALQWSTNIGITLTEISRILSMPGMLAFSMPVSGTFHELLESQRLFTKEATGERFFDNFTLVNHVVNAGYQILEIRQKNITFYFNDIFQLLSTIKNVGATYKKNSASSLSSKNYFINLEKVYLEHFGTINEQLPLTYSIVLILAKKIY